MLRNPLLQARDLELGVSSISNNLGSVVGFQMGLGVVGLLELTARGHMQVSPAGTKAQSLQDLHRHALTGSMLAWR